MIATTKILLELLVLYDEIIYDEFVIKKKYKSRKEFIINAIKEKLISSRIDLEPKQGIPLNEWWDEKDN